VVLQTTRIEIKRRVLSKPLDPLDRPESSPILPTEVLRISLKEDQLQGDCPVRAQLGRWCAARPVALPLNGGREGGQGLQFPD